MLWELFRPKQDADGTYVFQMPLQDGAIPLVHLEDLGPYVHWIFSHIDQSAELNLKVAIEHVPLDLIVSSFAKVTGKRTKAENLTMEEYFRLGGFGPVADTKMGTQTTGPNDKTLLTFRQNFTAWFNLYRRSGGNTGILHRDYAFLDEVFPKRVRSLEQWMRKVGYTGETKPVLKNWRGGLNGDAAISRLIS